ncbi:hypothetical protein HZA45_03595 [Candidatus Peregrinibacteria bacterium]|nr:hypothetical protein [Candidatus Peregrinibacteria bacterium]
MRKKKHTPPPTLASIVSMTILAVLCVTGSFAVGIETAGEMKAVAPLQANAGLVAGDMNGNGRIDEEDVTIILEIAKGQRAPTPEQLQADPSGDRFLTVEDAMHLLRALNSR